MRDIMTQLQQVLSVTVNGMTMADLGLSFNENNELQLDTGTLSTVLTQNLAGVTKLLSAQTTTSSSQLNVVNTGTSPQSFTLDVTVDSTGTLNGASVGGDSSGFSVVGNTIIGNSGTIYAGMAFTYTGSTSQSITVSSTSGLASQIYQLAHTNAGTSGQLQTLITNLQSRDTDLQSQVSDIQSNAATFKAQRDGGAETTAALGLSAALWALLRFTTLGFDRRSALRTWQIERQRRMDEAAQAEAIEKQRVADAKMDAKLVMEFESEDFAAALEKIRVIASNYDRSHPSAPSLKGFTGTNMKPGTGSSGTASARIRHPGRDGQAKGFEKI